MSDDRIDGRFVGVVVEGTLADGLKARLEGGATVEDLRVGAFVKVEGESQDFFCLVTDIQLAATDPLALLDPDSAGDDFLRQVLAGTTTYGAVKIQPMLMLPHGFTADGQTEKYLPVRTVPVHFSRVHEADRADFERVFGKEDATHFEMGRPLDMDLPICLDLKRFVERSNGVFGKSGTGKSFLTRLLLCGVIKSGQAVNLVFDMHSEYGQGARSEDDQIVEGLQSIFGRQKVKVFGLESGAGDGRAGQSDGTISIGLNEIEIEDVALLQDELQLNPTAVETANLVFAKHRDRWIRELLDMDADAQTVFARESGAHPGALQALARKLRRLDDLPFVKSHLTSSRVDEMLGYLEQNRHVVLEFGRFSWPLPYMLVANVITRRIHRRWSEKAEQYLLSRGSGDKPKQLMITIEEAHKFLNQRMASQTIFGTIAREMRKFQVTLLVVDQRPSGIDDEIMSQLGTRVTCLLTDDKDIEAVFSGVSNASRLRSILASLESREQAIMLGHAVPMPIVMQTRKYDADFHRAVRPPAGQLGSGPSGEREPIPFPERQQASQRTYRDIFGSDDE